MANVCDYSSMTHYNPGEFNCKYKTKLEGCVTKTNKEVIEDKTVLDSFKNGFYETFITTSDLILYRVYGRFKCRDKENCFGAKLTGAFSLSKNSRRLQYAPTGADLQTPLFI